MHGRRIGCLIPVLYIWKNQSSMQQLDTETLFDLNLFCNVIDHIKYWLWWYFHSLNLLLESRFLNLSRKVLFLMSLLHIGQRSGWTTDADPLTLLERFSWGKCLATFEPETRLVSHFLTHPNRGGCDVGCDGQIPAEPLQCIFFVIVEGRPVWRDVALTIRQRDLLSKHYMC